MTERIGSRTVRLIFEREVGRCAICGLPVQAGRANRHHRLPGKMGGRFNDPKWDTPANVVRCHSSCHDSLESKRVASYIAGWLVEENADPAEVPFLYAGLGWVLLDVDGGMTPCPAPTKRDVGERFVEAVAYDPSSFTARTEAGGGVAHPSPPPASPLGQGLPSPADTPEAPASHETGSTPGQRR